MARGEDALTILENSTSRSQFIDELMEVQTLVLKSHFYFELRKNLNIYVDKRCQS